MPKKIKPPHRLTKNKIERYMAKGRSQVPEGKHRRTFYFMPEELGIEVSSPKGSYANRRHYSAIVDTFRAPPGLSGKELKEASASYYRKLRTQFLEQIRESMRSSIIIPEAYDPEGLTTLEGLTTAGEEDVNS